MPKRYEKVEFKSFANGVSNTDFIEENAFANTFQIKIQNNKGSIDEAWSGIARPGSTQERDMEVHNGRAYTVEGKKVYTFNGTTFSVFQDFGGTENISIFKANEKLFIQKGPEGTFVLNENENSFVAIGGTSDEIYPMGTDVAVGDDGFIYFFHDTGTSTEVWKTGDDFFSSTKVFKLRSGYNSGCIANINGFIYFSSAKDLMRVTKTGVETAATSNAGPYNFSQFNKEYTLLFCYDNKDVKIEYFNGFRKELIKKIKNAALGEGRPFYDGIYTYIELFPPSGTTSQLWKFDKEGNAFKIWEADTSLGYPNPWVIRSWEGKIIFSSANDGKWYQTTNGVFATAGYIESGIISKGEHAPIRIIARHKPLLSNTGIKIYYSKDRSGSYGASVFTNAVAGSVRTEYDFPNTIGKISFIEVKVELTSSDSTKTPEDVEFDYIYKPLGLETSV